MAVSIKIRVCW